MDLDLKHFKLLDFYKNKKKKSSKAPTEKILRCLEME